MNHRKPTRHQFLKALTIVNTYKKNLEEEYSDMIVEYNNNKHLFTDLNRETLVRNCDISVRCINAIKSLSKELGFEDKCLGWSTDWTLTVKDLECLTLKRLYTLRNVGKKSIEEIKKLCFDAGIILNKK